MTRTPLPHPPAKPPTLAQALGITRPRPALDRWPPDHHLAIAVLAAVPVWFALGGLAGAHMRVTSGLWPWASLVLVRPLVEELVFRGLLQGQALGMLAHGGRPIRVGPFTLANLLVTLGFVALHLPSQPLAWAFAVAIPSLVFGHLRERFSSIWPAVGLHAFYNAGFGITAWLVRS